MPIALIAIAAILGIEIISRRYKKRILAKHQKRQAFDKMMASADNEQTRADIEARRRKMEERKGKGKGKGKAERARGRLVGGRMRKKGEERGKRAVGSDGYEVVDVTREWGESYKMEMDSWDFGGSGEW